MKWLQATFKSTLVNTLDQAVRLKDSALAITRRYPAHAKIDLDFVGDNGGHISGQFEPDRTSLIELDRQMRYNKHARKPEVLKVSPSSLDLHEAAHDPHDLGISHSIVDEYVPVIIEVHCTGFRSERGTHEMHIQVDGLPGLYRASFDLNRV